MNQPLTALTDFDRTNNAIHSYWDEQYFIEKLRDEKIGNQELENDSVGFLTDSHSMLQKKVSDLNQQLDDLSEQRLQELREKEKIASRLEAIVQSLPAGVVVLNQRGDIIDSNPVAENLLNKKLTGKRWRDVIHDCFTPKKDDGHEVSTRCGKRISIVTRSMDEDGQIIVLSDLTETRKLQTDVSRNERLSAMGKMVSTLAHQVRTPLSAAMIYANHLTDTSLDTSKHQAFTEKLLGRLHFMERQIRDMLFYVKGEVPLNQRLSINELLDELKDTIEAPIASHDVYCHWQINVSAGYLQCNLDAISGALLNIITNSIQAKSDVMINITVQQNGSNLNIKIYDNGPGFNIETIHQADELFFTTKAQGTGIGLAVVKAVVRSHGGQCSISNNKEGGACVSMNLPLVNTNKYECWLGEGDA